MSPFEELLRTMFVLGMIIVGFPSIVFGLFRFWQVFIRK